MLLAAYAVGQAWGWNWEWSWSPDLPRVWLGGRGVEGVPGTGGYIDRTFDVGRAPDLTVENFAGSLDVRSGDGNEIRIVAIKHAPRRSDLERIGIEITPEEGALRIETTKPRTLSNAWVEFTVTAPAGARLDLDTGSGSVEVSGFQGGAQVHTGSGSVAAWNLSGEVALETGSGSMKVQNVKGALKVGTGSGGIGIEGVEGEMEAHTGSGSVEAHGATGPARLSSGSGRVDYQGSPEGDCRFTTGSGGISLRLPDDLDARIDLHTGSGSVRVDYAVEGRITRTDVEGTIGRGGPLTIFAETGSGSIDLISE
jgi:DUF4097 and DUF4098 domain-containing protein YvlB